METTYKIIKCLLLTLFVIIFIITGCKKTNNSRYDRYKVEVQPKYKKGDVVYLKPDSLKVVVNGRSKCGCKDIEYWVYWFDKDQHKVSMTVVEELIY